MVRLVDRTAQVASRYYTLGGVLAGADEPVLAPDATTTEESFLDVILPVVDRCGDPGRAEAAERLLWSGQYVGDVNRLRPDLVEPATNVRAIRASARWKR